MSTSESGKTSKFSFWPWKRKDKKNTSSPLPETLAITKAEDNLVNPDVDLDTITANTPSQQKTPNDLKLEPIKSASSLKNNATTIESVQESSPSINKPSKKLGLFSRVYQGLKKTRNLLKEGFSDFFSANTAIDDALIEQLETQLLTADLGIEATETIITNLTQRVKAKQVPDMDALINVLQQDLRKLLDGAEQPLIIPKKSSPFVILVVETNGAGKTTSIGKLAYKLKKAGHNVMLAAGDTFRAAATEQLVAWGEKNTIPVIAQSQGSDSASVIFDAFQAAKARGVDVLIADTAGRLHNKEHLMEELKKINRILTKIDPEAPHETLLVIDAGTGQNALNQVRLFNDAIGITGLALTKLDGTAKGGVIFALSKTIKLPIRFIGVGEQLEDLQEFSSQSFIDALFDRV